MYIPEYKNSWALIIGINTYRNAPPLSYARHDAEAICEIIKTNFDFHEENVTLLLDNDATRDAISNSFLQYANGKVDHNDRIFVFFAGHGYTFSGKRGEVGYLVPVEGTTENLASLIRWDDLTRNSDLIPAKHILFIMDACYGGLAVQRSPGPGSRRFLKNMLQRYSRQVLTAGKADEVVADSGGPVPEHSVFTGHLLQGLGGNAATSDGIICANGLMAYVYEKVSKDINSQQTPHYGFIDGDGDFIFKAPILSTISTESETDKDVLIEQPPSISISFKDKQKESIVEVIKEFIPDSRFRIKLDDLITQEIRRVLYETTDEKFPVQTATVTTEEFLERLRNYEFIIKDLQSIIVLLSYWGADHHLPVLSKTIARIAEGNKVSEGKVVWLALRYYPTWLLLYSGGIAAIASGEYRNLFTLLTTKIGSKYSGDKSEEVIKTVVDEALELERAGIFKTLPGHERFYVPKSEYLYKALQPVLDDLLFLGNGYEAMFDRFEVFWALIYADIDNTRDDRIWGPSGRFTYKHRSRGGNGGPFNEVIREATSLGDAWPPLKAGLFGGSYERFQKLAEEYQRLIAGLPRF